MIFYRNIYKKINGLSNSSSCKVLQTFDLRKIHNRPLYQGPFKCKIPDLELLPNKVIRENKFPQHKRIMTANSNLNLPKQKTGFRSAIKSRPLIKSNIYIYIFIYIYIYNTTIISRKSE